MKLRIHIRISRTAANGAKLDISTNFTIYDHRHVSRPKWLILGYNGPQIYLDDEYSDNDSDYHDHYHDDDEYDEDDDDDDDDDDEGDVILWPTKHKYLDYTKQNIILFLRM